MSLKSVAPVENASAGITKGHHAASNGFIAWLIVLMVFVMYFLWAFLPGYLLDWTLLTYYPDKYWAVALPAMLVMSVVYYFSTSFLLVLYRTNPLTDGFSVADADAKEDYHSLESLSDAKETVPPLTEIPVSVTSRLLFQPWN
ncbi:phosphatidylinositol glycan, class P [Trypanosoma conorhini]|uniref:Phosphatidylinositol glycan, class P n=1 Tax=Trypanosoma conorhini TaxID=83891 RepID=A0A422PXM0_9TRYP|nr:phosphatidylinositol glycan, class P [Trypanosoma conorhini]RNF22480.1 phosphatidylinositol glycan, class P [Trypanosoma conorhini]